MSADAPWDDAGCSPSPSSIHKDTYKPINKAWTYTDSQRCWCQAIPEEHLLQTNSTFLFYLSFWILLKVAVCLCFGMQTSQRIYPWIDLCMWRLVCTYMNIYSKLQQMYALKSALKESWTCFSRPHLADDCCMDPFALKHEHSNMACCITSNINVWINHKNKSWYTTLLNVQNDFCYFVVFPNTVEKCWSVYHLLDRWLPCAVTCSLNLVG